VLGAILLLRVLLVRLVMVWALLGLLLLVYVLPLVLLLLLLRMMMLLRKLTLLLLLVVGAIVIVVLVHSPFEVDVSCVDDDTVAESIEATDRAVVVVSTGDRASGPPSAGPLAVVDCVVAVVVVALTAVVADVLTAVVAGATKIAGAELDCEFCIGPTVHEFLLCPEARPPLRLWVSSPCN
jgi:hypothetical protein